MKPRHEGPRSRFQSPSDAPDAAGLRIGVWDFFGTWNLDLGTLIQR
jgi:hypothetical protein